MELENLQENRIDGIEFIKKIDKEIENLFIKEYKKLQEHVSGLTEDFLIDLGTFKKLLSEHNNKKYCKFYYIQKDKFLNINISFSDNSQSAIKTEDVIYTLNGEFVKTEVLTKLKDEYASGIGAELVKQTKEEDTLVYYTLSEINSFIENMEKLHPGINKLKFNMWQYCPTNINGELSAHFTTKDKRISFCVHALVVNPENNKVLAESDAYDLGNLRP